MKTKNLLVSLILGSLLASLPAFAADYTLKCDDDGIFENPLVIRVHGGSASAEGYFSGPGDALFQIHYATLAVIPQQDGELSIEQGHLVGRAPGFLLNLEEEPAPGKSVKGYLKAVSTDSDRMPYSGHVSCERR